MQRKLLRQHWRMPSMPHGPQEGACLERGAALLLGLWHAMQM